MEFSTDVDSVNWAKVVAEVFMDLARSQLG